jgi:hypothetical protein
MKCEKCDKEMTHTEKGDYTCIADVWECECGYKRSSCYVCDLDGVGVASTERCEFHRSNAYNDRLKVIVGGYNYAKSTAKCGRKI